MDPGALRLLDLLDITLVALLLWAAIVGLRRSGATLALVGLAILGAIYIAAQRLELLLAARILEAFFAFVVIVLIVVFQADLRRFFEQIAVWGLRRRPPTAPLTAVDIVVRSVAQLTRARRGALLVFPGRESLERHVEGGVPISAEMSEPLMLSIFDPNSPGHDGAVLVHGDRISRFAVHLPLSEDRKKLGPGGTRHAAALGLAERTDALCIAVSEERGTVSIAQNGQLRVLAAPEELTGELRRFLAETSPPLASRRFVLRVFAERWREALAAVAAAAVLWFFLVAGETVVEATQSADVVVENLPAGYELEQVDPPQVDVVVEGPRRDVLLGEPLHVRFDALLVKLGRRTFTVSPAHVDHPETVRVLDVRPSRIRISVREPGAPAEAPAAADEES